jgi:hypothetical protein
MFFVNPIGSPTGTARESIARTFGLTQDSFLKVKKSSLRNSLQMPIIGCARSGQNLPLDKMMKNPNGCNQQARAQLATNAVFLGPTRAKRMSPARSKLDFAGPMGGTGLEQ